MTSMLPLVSPLQPQSMPYSTNETSQAATGLPDTTATLLDGLFPGFSLIQSFVLQTFSIDIGLLVTICVIALGGIKFSGYAWHWFNELIFRHITTSVHINDNDELYDAFTRWAAASSLSRRARSTQAVTPWRNLLSLTEEYDFSHEQRNTSNSPLFNYRQARAQHQLLNELHFGYHLLWHKGMPILVYRYYRQQGQTLNLGWSEEKQAWNFRCLGRSRRPIMSLLEHVRKQHAARHEGYTHIKRPGWDYGEMGWVRATTRGVRPMQSVIMEQIDKEDVVRDLNNFIWPDTAQWYASRGIPHRRGYLFSGPPGTGKTSLSFALSGAFGLHLHVLSLTDKSLSDSNLLDLFCNLPDRCIVLLEDVDTAGLKRKGMKDTKKDNSDKPPSSLDGKDPKKDAENDDGQSKVTLSGLLNAIDGVATHEGRVIIMTSNCPDELDPALIRPGRIDKHVKFGLATHRQIAELFLSVYTSDSAAPITHGGREPAVKDVEKEKVDVTLGDACREIKDSATRTSDIKGLDIKDLRGMSEEFARRVPEGKFSPAEVQGFLLLKDRNFEPRSAVREVEAWVEETLKEKKEKEEKEKKDKEGEDGVSGKLTGIWNFMG